MFPKGLFAFTLLDLKAKLRKVEHENEDLRFLNNEYLSRLRVAEEDAAKQSEKILVLQEKNLHAVVHTPG